MPKGNSGIRRGSKSGGAVAKAAPKQMTPEELLQHNIKETEKIAQSGLMPEAAIYLYRETPEQRTAFYEAIDRIYKKIPEGYSYSFREMTHGSGNKESFIQLELVYKSEKYDRKTGKMKTVRRKGMIMGPNGRRFLGVKGSPMSTMSTLTSQAALRGYAKALVYEAAGKIYDPTTGNASEKYPALDSYGEPKKG